MCIRDSPSAVDGIIDYASDHSCDLIVMGRRGLGAIRGLLGSVSYGVIRATTTPVLTVKSIMFSGSPSGGRRDWSNACLLYTSAPGISAREHTLLRIKTTRITRVVFYSLPVIGEESSLVSHSVGFVAGEEGLGRCV